MSVGCRRGGGGGGGVLVGGGGGGDVPHVPVWRPGQIIQNIIVINIISIVIK